MANPEGGALPRAPGALLRLARICGTDPYRDKLHTPFAVEWGGRKWAAATDGHRLAMVPFDGALRTDGPNVASVIPKEIKVTLRAEPQALLAFAGEKEMRRCEGCSGYGNCCCENCGDDHDCGQCGGEKHKRHIRYGVFPDGGGIDLDYLREIVETAPATPEIGIAHSEEMAPFVLLAPDWMALIMPIRPGSSELKDAPRFPWVCPPESQDRPPKASP